MFIKMLTPLCKTCKTGLKYKPLSLAVTNPALKGEQLLSSADNVIKTAFNKIEILTKYCVEKGFNPDEVIKAFNDTERFLGEKATNRLLTLANEGKIKLWEQPKIRIAKKKFDFWSQEDFVRCASEAKTNSILSYIKDRHYDYGNLKAEDFGKILKQLIEFESEGKIPAHEIAEMLKFKTFMTPEEYNLLLKAIETGAVDSKNIVQARLLAENGFSLKLLNAKTLDELSNNELRELANILASKSTNRKASDGARLQRFKDKICELDTTILPDNIQKRSEMLQKVTKKITQLTKINEVSQTNYAHFIRNFDEISNVFRESNHSIDDLVRAGGIKLKYSREEFKQNVLKTIEHLSESERDMVLSKFGLTRVSKNQLSGLPVYTKNMQNLTEAERAINKEINMFLNNNQVLIPAGFSEFQKPLNEICKTFPEFQFAVGSIQHGTHSKDLASHMLMAFQENLKNPLYKTLTQSDRRILGISTLLHDINKLEREVDELHPLYSSKTVNAIVSKMENLTTAERNRIINFVENHHWLKKIKEGKNFDPSVIDDLAYTFRKGNDFTMAKIFAESDLKAVNKEFFPKYGGKINSEMAGAIEERIKEIQSNGKLIYTTDVSLNKAIKMGAKKQILGSGSEVTENYVISAKDFGLAEENVLYHAPGKSDAFILAESGFGYGNEGVLSCSLGRAERSGTFQNRKDFIIFNSADNGNISLSAIKNANSGADKNYEMAKKWILGGGSYGKTVRNKYAELAKKELSPEDYAKIYRIASEPNFKLKDIHNNPEIQQILGGKDEARLFEKCIKEQNETYLSFNKTESNGFVPEIVCHDLEAAALGTNRNAEEIPYEIRKLYPLIITF